MLLRLKSRYLEQIDKMTRRQAVIALAVGVSVLAFATVSFLLPRTYQPGDIRGEVWFRVATVVVFVFFSVWVMVPSLLRLTMRR